MKTTLNYYEIKLYLSIVALVTVFSACSDASAPSIVSDKSDQETNNVDAYPVENSNVTNFAYPATSGESVVTQESYPAPVASEEFKEPRFRFDLPLTEGSTSASGQSPPNLAITIVDITFNGVVLGSGVSNDDGRFNVSVQPLPQGHRIGITFADLPPEKSFNDVSMELYPHRGDGFMNLPNVGIFFDTALVE
jgi:hypothetical protein